MSDKENILWFAIVALILAAVGAGRVGYSRYEQLNATVISQSATIQTNASQRELDAGTILTLNNQIKTLKATAPVEKPSAATPRTNPSKRKVSRSRGDFRD